MKFLNTLSLRTKLTLALLMAALSPLIGMTVVSFYTAEKEIFERQINQLNVINQRQLARITEFINAIDRSIKELQIDPTVLKSMKEINQHFSDRTSSEYRIARNALNKILQPIQRTLQIEDIYLVNLEGNIVYASETGHAWQYLGKSLPQDLIWTAPTTQYGFSYSSVFLNTLKSGNYDFLLQAPLYDQSGKVNGYVVFEVSLLPIYSSIGSRIGLGVTGESVLLKPHGNEALVLSPLRFNKLSVGEVNLPIDLSSENTTETFIDYRGHKSYGVFQKTPKLEFYILTMINQKEMMTSIYNLLSKNTLIMISAGFFIIITALFLSKQITKPLQALAKAAIDLKQKHFDIKMDEKLISSKDEIGVLAKAFQQMADELGSYYQSLTEMISKVEEAKEEALSASNAKSQFLTDMNHELRTPLTAIIGYSELLGEEAKEQQLLHFTTDLDKISVSAKQLLELINGMLDISKIEAGKVEIFLEEINIYSFVNIIANFIQPTIKKNQNRFILDCPPTIGMMTTDGTRLRQCLLNLLSNASKFTTNGEVRLSVKRDPDWIYFSVIDTGIGMNEEQISRLFEPFTQAEASTTRKFGGTGLGLYLSRSYAEMLGGTLTVESLYGKGSTFLLKLPIASQKNR